MATAAEIAKTFEAALIPVEPEQAERLAQQLAATHDNLDLLLGELLHSERKASENGYLVALAYKAARADVADPSRIVARLRRQADALDAKADSAVEDGGSFAGRAAGRRGRAERMALGPFREAEIAQAEADERSAAACHAEAVEATTEAFNKRVLADRIEGQLQRNGALIAVVSTYPMAAE